MTNQKERNKRIFTTSAELSEVVKGNLKGNSETVPKHTGRVPENHREFVAYLESMYQHESHPDLPPNFEDTNLGSSVMELAESKKVSKAIKDGDISTMKYITGIQEYENKLNGLHTLRELKSHMEGGTYIAYTFGFMGNGKTDFVNLFGEIAKKELDYTIGTNQKTLQEKDRYIPAFGDLKDWISNGHGFSNLEELEDLRQDNKLEPKQRKLMIFDEGSNWASGYSNDAFDTQELLGKLVKIFRKVGAILIIIGHTGKDIHPDIRRLSTHCIHKTGKKTADFYKTVDENGEGQGLEKSVSGIPPTNFTYDTNEICFWSWRETPTKEYREIKSQQEDNNQTKHERDLEIAKGYLLNEHPDIEPNEKGEIDGPMLADYYDLHKSRISQIVSTVETELKAIGEIET